MSSILTKEFKKKFEAILALENKVPVNEIFMQGMSCLAEHSLMYEQVITCDKLLPHKENRGGLMLSPQNAHKNAMHIIGVGADRTFLSNAVCIELAPDGPQRTANLEKNRLLIQKSQGLLAPMNDGERFLTLGCGHTAAFCKAAKSGCRTTQTGLADAKGKIDLHKLVANTEFRAMIYEGWSWKVISHTVDVEFPAWAKLAQKALNAGNHASTQVGELETAIMFTDFMKNGDDGNSWEDVAIQSVKDLNLPCASYCRHILDFVKEFGGGPSAPYIRLMDDVCKSFGCYVVLGETFWSLLVSTQFCSKSYKYPLIRVAMALVNLSSPKLEDGISRLLVKTDFAKVSSKKMKDRTEAADTVLKEAMSIMDLLTKKVPGFDESEGGRQAVGQLFVRVGLYITDKGKSGREERDYSLDEIKTLFLETCSQHIGQKVTFNKWLKDAPCASSASSASKDVPNETSAAQAANAAAATLADHSDPVWVAKNKGFTIGCLVYERLGTPVSIERVYKIKSISDTSIKLDLAVKYDGKNKPVETSLENLLSCWNVTKMEPPVELTICETETDNMEIDDVKCKIYQALRRAESSKAAESLVFWRRPDQVRTSESIPAGKLKLFPKTPMSLISTKASQNSVSAGKHTCNGKQIEFFMQAPAKPAFDPNKPNHLTAGTTVSAFWWVGITHVKAEANMTLEWHTDKTCSIMVMKNKVALQPFQRLLRYVPSKACKVSTAEPVQEDDKDDEEENRPAKKSKRE